jgi:hypothetical protein
MTNERTHFARQDTDNVECRIYHTRMILTDFASQGVMKCDGVENMVDGVLSVVIAIPGVVSANVEPHKLTVVKSPVFDWEEIEPKIRELFQFAKIPELLRHPAPGLPELWLNEGQDLGVVAQPG